MEKTERGKVQMKEGNGEMKTYMGLCEEGAGMQGAGRAVRVRRMMAVMTMAVKEQKMAAAWGSRLGPAVRMMMMEEGMKVVRMAAVRGSRSERAGPSSLD